MLDPPAVIAIACLRRIATALEAGELPTADDCGWLADRLRRYDADAARGLTIELALDLSPAVGGASWWRAEELARRDELILQIAADHFAGLSPPKAGKALAREWARYSRCARRADLDRGQSNAPQGSLRRALFELAEVVEDLPEVRRLADIIADAEDGEAA